MIDNKVSLLDRLLVIPVVAGIDIDETCKYAFEANNDSDFIHANITDLTSKEVSDLYPEDCIKILVGCAPCQPFSPHTQKNKKRIEDEKWKRLYQFSKLLREVQLDIVSAENVPAMTRSKVFTPCFSPKSYYESTHIEQSGGL